MRAVVAFVKLGRPMFLGGGVLLFALGAAIANTSIDLTRYALGQLAVTAFQLMTHYANDYYDVDADRANATPTMWSGGSRVLVAGELAPGVALTGALVFAALGLAATAALDDSILLLLAIGAIAWEYSAPPLRLCARGAGELATAIVVTVLVPWLGFHLQRGDDTRTFVLAIVPLALLQFAMLLAIEFPDAAGDAASNKRTLVVRLGARRAGTLYAVTTALAYVWLPLAVPLGLPAHVALAASATAPLAAWRIARLRDTREPGAFERMTFFAVLLLVATTACELVAFLA